MAYLLSDTAQISRVAGDANVGASRKIEGTNVLWGDGDTGTAFISVPANSFGFAGGSGTYERIFELFKYPLPASYWGRTLYEARWYLGLTGTGWTGTFPAEGVTFSVYAVRVTIDITDASWAERDDSANVAWGTYGGQLGVDLESVPLASATVTAAEQAAIAAGTYSATNPLYKEIVLTREIQRLCWQRATHWVVQLRPDWATGGNNANRYFVIAPPAPSGANQSSYWRINSLPPLAWFGMSGGQPDFRRYLPVGLVDEAARVQLGYPAPGSFGVEVAACLVNTTPNPLTRIGVVRSGAYPTQVKNPASRRKLQCLRPTENAIGNFSLRIVPKPGTESTQYQVYRTPENGTEDVSPLSTSGGAAYGTYAADTTFRISGIDAFTIRSAWWDATAIVNDEVWTCTVLANSRPAGYTTAAADRLEMAPHIGLHDGETEDREQASSNRWVRTGQAVMAQLRSDASNASYEAASRGHLPLAYDATYFRVGDVVEVYTGDVASVERHVVRAVLDYSHGSLPDTLILETALADPGDFTAAAKSSVHNGVLIGDLGQQDRVELEAAAAAGASYVVPVDPPRAISGTIRLLNADNGNTETHAYTYSSVSGRITFSGAEVLAYDYPAGSVGIRAEDASNRPVFFRLNVEEDAATEQQLALVRGARQEVK